MTRLAFGAVVASGALTVALHMLDASTAAHASHFVVMVAMATTLGVVIADGLRGPRQGA